MILVIAIVLGALVGAGAGGEAGALAGALFGWLILRSLRQQREIDTLRKRAEAPVEAAAQREARAEPAAMAGPDAAAMADSPVATTSAAAMPPAALASAMASEPPPAVAAPALSPLAQITSTTPSATVATPAPVAPNPKIAGSGVAAPPPRDVLEPIRRWLFGGNTIVKAGVGILFVGLAFLAKYASEHAHLPIEYRLGAIGLAAVALLAFGWRLRVSRPDYAQVLQGGAVAVLYLTLFAAFRFYAVIDAMPAFVLMVAVAALAAALAVLQDARSLAIIGALGGFATPLDRLDRLRQLRRPVLVLLRSRSRHRRGRVVQDMAAAQPDRLRRHLRRRHRLGRAQVPARGLRHQPGVPDRLLPALRRHPRPAGAPLRARRGRSRGRRAAPRRVGQQQPPLRPADGHLRARVRPRSRHALRCGARRTRSRRLLRAARELDEAAPRARHHLRRDARHRDDLPHPRHPVRARRAQHRRRLDARGRRPDLDRLSPAARTAAPVRLPAARSRRPGDAARPPAPRHADA